MADLVDTIRGACQDPNGDGSSKRLCLFVFSGVLVLAGVADYAGHPLHDHILDIFAFIVASCVGGATLDHFAAVREDRH